MSKGKPYQIKSAAMCAMFDILKELKNCKRKITYYNRYEKDVWVVTPRHLYTKESRKLNSYLGIKGINHEGNNKGKKH